MQQIWGIKREKKKRHGNSEERLWRWLNSRFSLLLKARDRRPRVIILANSLETLITLIWPCAANVCRPQARARRVWTPLLKLKWFCGEEEGSEKLSAKGCLAEFNLCKVKLVFTWNPSSFRHSWSYATFLILSLKCGVKNDWIRWQMWSLFYSKQMMNSIFSEHRRWKTPSKGANRCQQGSLCYLKVLLIVSWDLHFGKPTADSFSCLNLPRWNDTVREIAEPWNCRDASLLLIN